MYSSLGRWCYRHPWRVVFAWILLVAVVGLVTTTVGSSFGGNPEAGDADSSRGADILEEHFGLGGSLVGGQLVFRAEQGVQDPTVRAAMSDLFEQVDAVEGVIVVSPYAADGARRIAADGAEAGLIAYADIDTTVDIEADDALGIGEEINHLIDESGVRSIDGLQVHLGDFWFAGVEPPESEAVGLAFAVFVLIMAVGSVVAMGLTVGVALVGVAVGVAGVSIWSNIVTVPEFAITIGLMIGIGVGIDYALFIIIRYREWSDRGLSNEDAVAAALDSAGRSVVFASVTVVVSLLGLLLMGVSLVSGLGLAAATTVALVMLGSITLLPAAIGFAGGRMVTTRVRGVTAATLIAVALFGFGTGLRVLLIGIPLAALVMLAGAFGGSSNPLRRVLPPRRTKPLRETNWYRFSRMVQSRPWLFAVGGTLVLLLLAAPVLSLRLGTADEGNFAPETSTRKAYDLIAEGFGLGANGPLLVVAETSGAADLATLEQLSGDLNRVEGVVFASPVTVSSDGQAALIHLQPTTGPQDQATEDLVQQLRDETIPQLLAGAGVEPLITGSVAFNIDFADYLSARIPIFLVAVLALSFLLLMAVFRSVLVPLKAVIMNMLSIGGAYGVCVAIFQWGWLGSVIGVEPAPIDPLIPMMMFAMLYGLSMDYEVFLLSRMKEEYERTGDAVNSVADGLAATARVITAAAAVMVVVFGSFTFEVVRVIQLFGLGLAIAIALDATLVRMLIVPSTMELLGERNWWMPRWLDRIIPNLRVEGDLEMPATAAALSGGGSGAGASDDRAGGSG